MRLLGLDVGTKTIGIAVSDPLGYTAQGITTLRRKKEEYDIEQIIGYLKQYEVEKVVCGLPLNMNGSRSESTALAEDFAAKLQLAYPIEVIFQDERLSTVAAEKILISGDVSRSKRKKVIDKMAAVIILQNYLDYLFLHK